MFIEWSSELSVPIPAPMREPYSCPQGKHGPLITGRYSASAEANTVSWQLGKLGSEQVHIVVHFRKMENKKCSGSRTRVGGVEGLPVRPQAERDQQDAARCDGTQGVPTPASLRPLSPGPLKSLVPATPGSSS